MVDFDAGVRLSKRFPNPGVEFIIQAPEDQDMQGKLSSKSVEERSKLAVTMLASGMYFDGSNNSTANAAMNSALMGFLQSQVNSITGRALTSMGVDLTANMESTADASGSLHILQTIVGQPSPYNHGRTRLHRLPGVGTERCLLR